MHCCGRPPEARNQNRHFLGIQVQHVDDEVKIKISPEISPDEAFSESDRIGIGISISLRSCLKTNSSCTTLCNQFFKSLTVVTQTDVLSSYSTYLYKIIKSYNQYREPKCWKSSKFPEISRGFSGGLIPENSGNGKSEWSCFKITANCKL